MAGVERVNAGFEFLAVTAGVEGASLQPPWALTM